MYVKVKNCPSCGSESVDHTANSYEYQKTSHWSCNECDWYYKEKSGMGGGRTSGTHPRDVGPESNQKTLSQTGELCSNCHYVVILEEHFCDPVDIVDNSDEPVSIKELEAKLEEWHSSPRKVIREAIESQRLALEPTFFRAVVWPTERTNHTEHFYSKENELTKMHTEILRELSNEKDPIKQRVLADRMATQDSLEAEFIYQVCKDLIRKGEIREDLRNGIYIPETTQE